MYHWRFVLPHGRWLVVLMGLAFLLSPSLAWSEQEGTSSRRLTLSQAIDLAFAQSPVLRARQAEVQRAQARLVTARTYLFNPELDIAAGRRTGPVGRSTDSGVALTQEIEIAGQRGKRKATAESGLAAAEARFLREKRLLAAQVELSFAEAVRARELLGVEATDLALADDFLRMSEKRFEAGASSQIEVNLARAAAGRASRRVELARAQYEVTRNFLAEIVGLDPVPAPEPEGELQDPTAELPDIQEFLQGALENRADLEAFRHTEEEAAARLRLAKAEAVPNLRLGAFYAEEESVDTIVGGGISIALPFFNRNQGGISEANAAIVQTGAERAALGLAVQREVAAAFATYEAAKISAERLRELVLGTLEENLTLLQRSFAAGKISATDLLVFNREFVDSQREFIDTISNAWVARIALDLAAGSLAFPETPPTTQPSGLEP